VLFLDRAGMDTDTPVSGPLDAAFDLSGGRRAEHFLDRPTGRSFFLTPGAN